MFNRLKQFRRIATRYDKTRKSFAAFLSSSSKVFADFGTGFRATLGGLAVCRIGDGSNPKYRDCRSKYQQERIDEQQVADK